MEMYLIQKGNVKNSETDDSGIDSHVSWTYMGSSEFEWGALPTSLRSMKRSTMITDTITIKGKEIFVFLPDNVEISELQTNLEKLSDDDLRLQEYNSFHRYFGDEELSDRIEDVWWDIGNNIMFSFNEEFMKKLPTYIENSMKKDKILQSEKSFLTKGREKIESLFTK